MTISNSTLITLEFVKSVALIVSLINVCVFTSLRHHGLLYKCLLLISSIDLTYLSLTLFTYICDNVFQYPASYESDEQLRSNAELFSLCYINARIFIREYLMQVLVLLSVFMEIWVTTVRIRIIANNAPYKPAATSRLIIVFTVLVFVSTTLHAPILFTKRVELAKMVENETSQDSNYVHVVQTEFGKSRSSLILRNFVTFVRIISISVILVALKLVAICKYWSILNCYPKLLDLKR
jgi:hypothetical protein